MKELSIEEKAKRFDEALKQIKECNPDENGFITIYPQEIFPELKESEGDNIRKEMLDYCHKRMNNEFTTITIHQVERWLSWLEKQGEQQLNGTFINADDVREDFIQEVYRVLDADSTNDRANQIIDAFDNLPTVVYSNQGEQKPVGKVESNFNVGDWVINLHGEPQAKKVEKYSFPDSIITSPLGVEMPINTTTLEKQFRHWTIQDAKDGDVLVHSSFMFDDFIFIYNTTSILQAYCYYSSEKKRFIIEDGGHYCPWNMQEVKPATKEQRDTLIKSMTEAGYGWDAEKKKLKKIEQKSSDLPKGEDYGIDGLYNAIRILEKTLGKVDGYQTDDGILEHECAISAVKKLYEQKPAWSDEDEKDICRAAEYIRKYSEYVVGGNSKRFVLDLADRIESLRPHNRWKPSEEQMKWFGDILDYHQFSTKGQKIMQSLYNDLKKLREE